MSEAAAVSKSQEKRVAAQKSAEHGEAVFLQIRVADLCESKTNPRRHFAGIKELAASVKQHGVLTPLLVRESDWKKVGGAATYEIISGARRYRAATNAGLDAVPCRVMKLDDVQALEFQVIENLQREDVHPLDEALGYKHLREKGYTTAQLAAKVNKSERYIQQRMQLATLLPEAQKDFLDGKFSASHAELLCRLQPPQQKECLRELRGDEPSVRQLRDWIERNAHLDLGAVAFPLDDKGDAKSSQLLPGAVACVSCPKRTGANPLLFADVKEGDTCTDPQCFHGKERAFVKIQLGLHPEDKMLTAGHFYSYGDKKPKGLIDWVRAKNKACKDAVNGIVVENADRYGGQEPLGKRMMVCPNPRCRVHHESTPSSSHRPSPAEKRARAKSKAEDQARGLVEIAAAKKIWEKVPDCPAGLRPVLGEIACTFDDQLYGSDEFAQLLDAAAGRKIRDLRKDLDGADWLRAGALMAFHCDKDESGLLKIVKFDWKKELAAAVKAANPKKGVCRVCGCTEKKGCKVKPIPGSNATMPCGWADKTKTLCDNPACLKTAGAVEEE